MNFLDYRHKSIDNISYKYTQKRIAQAQDALDLVCTAPSI